MRRRRSGSVLLLVVIILGVLMVIGAAVMQRGVTARASAAAVDQFEGSVTCARAAYGVLWADFLASGSTAYQGMPRMQIPDPEHPGANIELSGQHFDQDGTCDATCLSKIRVRLSSATAAGAKQGATESTNTFREGFGGTPYRYTAHCKYPSGAEYEVEFLLRLGM